jgi:hypothetical protein
MTSASSRSTICICSLVLPMTFWLFAILC